MKVRHKEKGYLGSSGNFNMHGLGEMIVYFEDGDCSSEFIRDYEVFLKQKQEWKDINQAFKDKDIINDNYNTCFFEPPTEDDRVRGFTLY